MARYSSASRRLNTILQENLAGIKVVKAFAQERHEAAHFSEATDSFMEQQLEVARIFTFLFPIIFLIGEPGAGGDAVLRRAQIIGGSLTLGEWQKFSLYLIYVFLPIGQLGFIISLMAQASASAGRIFEILDAKSDVTDKPGAATLPARSRGAWSSMT